MVGSGLYPVHYVVFVLFLSSMKRIIFILSRHLGYKFIRRIMIKIDIARLPSIYTQKHKQRLLGF